GRRHEQQRRSREQLTGSLGAVPHHAAVLSFRRTSGKTARDMFFWKGNSFRSKGHEMAKVIRVMLGLSLLIALPAWAGDVTLKTEDDKLMYIIGVVTARN